MPELTSSIERPLALRLRADLQGVPVEMAGQRTWIVKDPVTLAHFQFTAAEYALMDALREPVSIADLQRLFQREFAPQTITPQAIWAFLSRLHEEGLVISESAGQGRELLARMRRDRARRWASSWASLLAIRFRGIDPDAFLTAIHSQLGWLWSKAMLLPVLGLIMYAAWLAIAQFEAFVHRLPEAGALFEARNLPWLVLAIGTVKVLHELGHALACKHFGGEVRELGFMLLVFVPCLYCDVSDAWRLPGKWRRIAVSAAGIGVELLLAAVATIIWWHAQPGALQIAAMNVMIVCTVSTLLVNGNPLLRYDGYYILSDLTETPNLWQRSRDVLRRAASRWFFTSRAASAPDDDPLVPARRRGWLALYAVASKLYLALVLVAIVWGLVEVLYPYHLQNLAYLVGLTVVGGTMAGPVRRAARWARDPLRRQELRGGRVAVAAAVLLAAAIAALSLPVNYYVTAPVVLMPEGGARVYATIEGALVETLPAGARVQRGEAIARLDNGKTELELARLEGERQLRQLRIEHLERLRGLDRKANDSLPTARAALADAERRLAELRREADRLRLRAPVDGVVISAPHRKRHATADSGRQAVRLATWTGSLLDAGNRGARVEPGTLVCLVGDPSQLTAVLLVDGADIKRLQPGQRARLRLEQLPGRVLEGELVDVARHDVRETTRDRADLESLFEGVAPPEHRGALYQARLRFDLPSGVAEDAHQRLVIGGRGQAKVAAERITLGRRILRYCAQTFRLPM